MVPLPSTSHRFVAAVERPLSVVFKRSGGQFEGHDYVVEVTAWREGLDEFDVVVDFRDLEAAMDDLLRPMDRQVLDLEGPGALAAQIHESLASRVPAPAKLAGVALTDGRGWRITFQP